MLNQTAKKQCRGGLKWTLYIFFGEHVSLNIFQPSVPVTSQHGLKTYI